MKDSHNIRPLFVTDNSSGVFSASQAFADFLAAAHEDGLDIQISPAGVGVLNDLQETARDFAIYSRENSVHASCLDQLAQVFPGFQLIHDASFEAMYLEKHLGNAFPEALRKELRERFEQDLDILADTFVRGWSAHSLRRGLRWKSPLDESAGLRIVSSPGLLRFYPDARVCPIPISLTPGIGEREGILRELGLDPTKKVVVTTAFGSRGGGDFLVSEVVQELEKRGLSLNVLKLAEEGDRSTGVATISNVSDIFHYLSVADFYLSLGAEEFTGVAPNLLRALGLGIPGIVSRTRMNESLPPDAIIKIRPGFSEVRDCVDAILSLEKDFLLKSGYTTQAREFVRSKHSCRQVMKEFILILQEDLPTVMEMSSARRESAKVSRERLLETLKVSLSQTDPWLSAHYSNAFYQAARDLGW